MYTLESVSKDSTIIKCDSGKTMLMHIDKHEDGITIGRKGEFICSFLPTQKGSIEIDKLPETIEVSGKELLEFTLDKEKSFYSWRNGIIIYKNKLRNISIIFQDEYWDEYD